MQRVLHDLKIFFRIARKGGGQFEVQHSCQINIVANINCDISLFLGVYLLSYRKEGVMKFCMGP